MYFKKNKTRGLLFWSFVLSIVSISAQAPKASPQANKTIDSLLAVLKVSSGDSTRIKTLVNLSWEYVKVFELDKAVRNANDALLISDAFFQSRVEGRKVPGKNDPVFYVMIRGEAKAYNNLGVVAYYNGEIDAAIKYYTKSADLSKSVDDRKGMAYAYANLGSILLMQGEHKRAVELHLKALELTSSIGDKYGMANAYNNLGNDFEQTGEFHKALDAIIKGLKIMEERHDKKGVSLSLINIAGIYTNKGDYAKALEFYFKALRINEETKDRGYEAAIYNNLGNVYYAQGDKSKATMNYFKALEIKKSLNDTMNEHYCNMISNIGVIHHDQKNDDKAIQYYQRALNIRMEINDQLGIASCYNNIGNLYYDKSDYTNALKYQAEAIKIYEEIGSQEGVLETLHYMGYIFLYQRMNDKAKQHFQKSLEMAKTIAALPNIMQAYLGLAQADSALGNYKGAYLHHKLYIATKDSIDNEEADKKAVQAEMNFEFEKKEALATAEHKLELEKQEAIASEKSRKQKMVTMFTLIGLLFVTVFSVFVFRSLKITKKQKQIIEVKSRETEEQKRIAEEQKHLVEEKQKEIIDSIQYARRIQRALITNEKYISKSLTKLKRQI